MAEKVKVVTELLKRREVPYWALGPAIAAGYAFAKAVIDYREWKALGEGITLLFIITTIHQLFISIIGIIN